MYNNHYTKGFDIVAVAKAHDPPNRVGGFIQFLRLAYEVTRDTGGRTARSFGDAQLTPASLIFAHDGGAAFQTVSGLSRNNQA